MSVVVPMLDAGHRFAALRTWTTDLLDRLLPDAEVILVDDGSTDGTWAAVLGWCADDPRVRGVRLARNVGQTGALCAGFVVARAPVVVTLDDDLEADAQVVPALVEAVRGGVELASGRRIGTRSVVRALGSRAYNRRLRSWGLPFHDAGCGVNALTRDLGHRLATEGWGASTCTASSRRRRP